LHKFEINYRLFELTMQLNSGGLGWGRVCGTAKPPVLAGPPTLSWQHILHHPESMSDMPL